MSSTAKWCWARALRARRLAAGMVAAVCAAAACLSSSALGGDAPLIQWFRATPSTIASGGSTSLRWHVDGASSVNISPNVGAVAGSGSVIVSPAATTTYTITAGLNGGSVSKTAVVVVGPHPSTAPARYAAMVTPVSGQDFTAPATLRVFAAAFDGGNYIAPTGCGIGQNCASRVDFYVDDTLMAQVSSAQSEFYVFNTTLQGVAAGTHRVWARATFVDPPAILDSDSMWITVNPPPAYAQTIDLTQDVVLSGAQDYAVLGSAGGRIRINGQGHRIRALAGWTGRLDLRHVDVFDLGLPNEVTPAIEIATAADVRIENCTFDTTGTVALVLNGTVAATIRGNTWRSNGSMPESQLPGPGTNGSYPAFSARGNSTAAKVFEGNRIGLGSADFQNTDHWTIGGDSDAQGNIVIGARGGIVARNTTRTVLRRNLIYHVYFGGWSQGDVVELSGASDVVVEHNLIGGGSWPVRGLGGTFAYNLVLDAGHQWLWVAGSNASVHHNVFVGGSGDIAGIMLIYGPQNVRIYNNTLDGLGQATMYKPIWAIRNGAEVATGQLRSNAVVNMRNPPAVQVDGVLDADYNLFSGQQGTTRNYSDNRLPLHDVGGPNAQIEPQFLEPSEPFRHGWEDLWTGAISARQVLANYRTRYTPAPGSPLRDAGDPGGAVADSIFCSGFEAGESQGCGVAGNDIGAIGSGVTAIDDLFGT